MQNTATDTNNTHITSLTSDIAGSVAARGIMLTQRHQAPASFRALGAPAQFAVQRAIEGNREQLRMVGVAEEALACMGGYVLGGEGGVVVGLVCSLDWWCVSCVCPCTHTYVYTHLPTHTLCYVIPMYTHTYVCTHTHTTHSLSHTHTRTLSFSLSLSRSLSPLLPHTHFHSHTPRMHTVVGV